MTLYRISSENGGASQAEAAPAAHALSGFASSNKLRT